MKFHYKMDILKLKTAITKLWRLLTVVLSDLQSKCMLTTVERLSLRLQICLNFRRIVYFIETQVQQPKIIET